MTTNIKHIHNINKHNIQVKTYTKNNTNNNKYIQTNKQTNKQHTPPRKKYIKHENIKIKHTNHKTKHKKIKQ